MIICPNCGTQNEPGAHFCAECGADLGSLTSATGAPQPTIPAPPLDAQRPVWVAGQGWVKPNANWPTAPRSYDAGEAKPRRTWLWVILMAIALLIVLCCISSVWLQTSSGQHFYHNIQTRAAKQN